MALPQQKDSPLRSQKFEVDGNAAHDNEEQQIAAQFYANKNRARRGQQNQNKDPNESDRVELEKLESEIKEDDLDSSIGVKDLGNGNLGIDLKFDVPLDPARAENITQWKNNRKKFRNPSTKNQLQPPPPDNNALQSEKNSPPPEQRTDNRNNPPEEGAETYDTPDTQDTVADDELEDILDETYDPYPLSDENDTTPSSPSTTEETSSRTMIEEDSPSEQQTTAETQAQQMEKQKEYVAKMEQQRALREKREHGQLARAEKIKQKLDNKLKKLRAELLMLKALLYATKALKALVDVVQSAVRWLAHGCMSLAWTIILGIISIILYLIYGLLFIPKMALLATIKLTEKRIDALNEDIEATKKNQQKAVSVIQSLMTRRRTGSPPSTQPKFKTSSQAS